MRRVIILLLLVITLGIVNVMVWNKEKVIKNGDRIILPLGPRDPQSIMQGDYMRLSYQFPQWLNQKEHLNRIPHFGQLLVERNAKTYIAKIVQVYGYNRGKKQRDKQPQKLKPNQYLIRYKRDRWKRVVLAAQSFFFQQGQARYYSEAKFADIRVDSNGEVILVDMLDAKLQSIRAIAKQGSNLKLNQE
ncbi:hypothetical protein MNBD_GAMMA12-2671 [hydrothermal vent metagenome]|uniref:Membrane-anchored protein n=1 Tax=hydrothermal vent metagenome TaxID=652676 RepID=A0A3B0Z423_9ZZZZ